jgi:CheY-like chemotaxis protein
MRKALILIIDQSQDTRAMYGDYFRHHGYTVVEAADGMEGVRLFRQFQPDLVVTELSEEQEWMGAIRSIVAGSSGWKPASIACSTSIDPSWPFPPPGVDVDMAVPKPVSPRSLLEQAEQLLAHLTPPPRALAV